MCSQRMSDSSSDSEIESVDLDSPPPRPSRQKSLPSKYRNGNIDLEELQCDPKRVVLVRCSQTGKQHSIKVKDLSKENDEPLSESDLVQGADLMMTYRGKPYPVKFIQFKESKKGSKRAHNDEASTTAKKKKTIANEDASSTSSTTILEVLDQAKRDATKPSAKKPKIETVLDNEDKDLIIQLSERVEKVENTLAKLKAVIEATTSGKCTAPQQSDDHDVVNGVDLTHIPSRDAYCYALQLMDVFFNKEELSKSLVFKSKKSSKPPLDQDKVHLILSYIKKRYKENWDMKTLTSKMNQKCRDSKVHIGEAPAKRSDAQTGANLETDA